MKKHLVTSPEWLCRIRPVGLKEAGKYRAKRAKIYNGHHKSCQLPVLNQPWSTNDYDRDED